MPMKPFESHGSLNNAVSKAVSDLQKAISQLKSQIAAMEMELLPVEVQYAVAIDAAKALKQELEAIREAGEPDHDVNKQFQSARQKAIELKA